MLHVFCAQNVTQQLKNTQVMCLELELMYFQIYWIYLFIFIVFIEH